MLKRPIFFFLIALLIAGCKKEYVAQVGSVLITEKDLEYRAKVSEIYYPKSGQRYVALAQLIQGYLDEEILKQLGYKVDESVWEMEEKRIDQNTKAPEQLKKIKEVYGLDHSAYIKTFIREVYAQRFLYNEVFLKSAEIHRERRQKAENFLQQVIAWPESFKELAEKADLKFSTMFVSEKEGIQPYESDSKRLEPAERWREPLGVEQAKFLIEKVKKLKPGEVLPEIIEWQEGYQILRLLRKEGDGYLIETVNIPKIEYDQWRWSYASKIPVRINNSELKAELLKKVGWASKLKLE